MISRRSLIGTLAAFAVVCILADYAHAVGGWAGVGTVLVLAAAAGYAWASKDRP